MNFSEIQIINQNSFIGGKLIAYFLSGCLDFKIDLGGVYLLLPLIYKNESRKALSRANSRSTIESIFLTKNREMLAGIEQRFYFFENLTNSSLIVAANDYGVNISKQISIDSPLNLSNEQDPYMKKFYKASYQLGHILSKRKISNSYIKLGIRYI